MDKEHFATAMSDEDSSQLEGQAPSRAGHIQHESEAERRAIRKLDAWIIPPVMLLYIFSFLDRVNIGNARLYGLEKDLGLKGTQFQLAVSILFVTYVLAEIPSNMVIKKFRPSRWLSFITTAWGIVATLTGIVQDFRGLVVCRLVLGALEGGLFPGLTIYLTFFYTKRDLALRIAYLFVGAAIAGSCGGLLAYAIGFMDGIAGLRAWRWIMILEGIPAVILGILCLFWLANDLDSASYLTADEQQLLLGRMHRQAGHSASGDRFHRDDVHFALKDWKIWAFCVAQFGVDTMLYGYSVFLPTIIRSLGTWTVAQVQALTIPCYLLGAVTYILVAYLSDRYQQRGIPTMLFALVSIIGYALLITPVGTAVRYFGCFLVAMGLYVSVGIPIAWLASNNPRYAKRTLATGMQVAIGNCSGIMAPFLYPTKEGPRYLKGHATTLSLVAMAAAVYLVMTIQLGRINKAREVAMRQDTQGDLSRENTRELGDKDPMFRYTC